MARAAPHRITLGVLALTVMVSGSAVLAGTSAAAAQSTTPQTPSTYIWPVSGTVIDPFRPPQHEYGPGNRGIEFATLQGSSYWAAASGVVSFAGPVGARRHVTVTHADGLRVSYSGVATIDVVRGQRVRQGEMMGTTADRLHVGVRRGDVYIDPALVFNGRGADDVTHLARVRLVSAGFSVYRLQLRWLHSGAGAAVL